MNTLINNQITDSRIGILCREGNTIYYAYINTTYFEHKDIEEVKFTLDMGDRFRKSFNEYLTLKTKKI